MTTSTKTKTVLIAGATGRQGQATIQALEPPLDDLPAFRVLALTRDASSATCAKCFNGMEHVTVVQGNLDSEESLRAIFEAQKPKGGIWGVFCVLAFPGLGANADGEEKQGQLLADLALEYGVSVYVFSSVERGGEISDDKLVLDRRAKVRIERHVRQLGEKGLPWTILRPAFFMENYDGAIGAITVAVLKAGLKPTTAVQLVAVADVGGVAGAVFKNPEMYREKILVVSGEASTIAQQEETHKKVTGKSLPSTAAFIARGLIAINGNTQGLIEDIERVHRQRVNGEIPEVEKQTALAKAAYPRMQTFQMWLDKKKIKITEKRKAKWNGVTIGRLVTGQQ